MFELAHHRRIGRILRSLDARLLRDHNCWFGGGTAISLLEGEYRQSLDIDFLVAERQGYRGLRGLLAGARDLGPVTRAGAEVFAFENEVRVDRYGIRAFVVVEEVAIKFEIVHEGRITFEQPGVSDTVCGVATLSRVDLAASKLLANADRWRDAVTYSRDVLDLAMLQLPQRLLGRALDKAAAAYGPQLARDASDAVDFLRTRPERLLQCMQALSITLPPAIIQQNLRRLAQRLERLRTGV